MIEPIQEGFVHLDADIYYRIYGTAEQTLVMLHGNGEDWKCFKHQIEPFAAQYRLLLIDSRAHGKSSRGTAPLTIEQLGEDTYQVMRELNIEHAHVLGFSDGANAAIALALQHGEVIDKLVLGGANLFPKALNKSILLPYKAAYLACKVFALFAAEPRAMMEVIALMLYQPNFTFEQLAEINAPTLVLAGTRDLIKEQHTEQIADSIPNSQLEFIYDTDHFIFAETVKPTNGIILKFLSDGTE